MHPHHLIICWIPWIYSIAMEFGERVFRIGLPDPNGRRHNTMGIPSESVFICCSPHLRLYYFIDMFAIVRGMITISWQAFTSPSVHVKGMTKTTRNVRGECGKGCLILFSTHPIYLIQAATMLTNLLWETDYKLLRSAPGDTCKSPAC